MKKRLRDNGLSIALFATFAALLIGHSLAGRAEYNEQRQEHGQSPVTYGAYLTSGHFMESVFENWESEFLQMAAYVLMTVFLYQRGSSESKDPDKDEEVDEDPALHQTDTDAPWAVRRGGWPLRLYNHSLSFTLLSLFLLSFLGHAIGGMREYNEEQEQKHKPAVSLVRFMRTPQFWFQSLENWQSEFLAVGLIVVLTIKLREKGSPESKPVFAPHKKTGES